MKKIMRVELNEKNLARIKGGSNTTKTQMKPVVPNSPKGGETVGNPIVDWFKGLGRK